jgi:hypothetical protein
MRWLRRCDIALRGQAILTRVCSEFERSEQDVGRVFADAARRFGVEVFAIGQDALAVYCGVYVPKSAREAEERLIWGAKVKVLEPLMSVYVVAEKEWQACLGSQSAAQRSFLDDLIS